jgi:hypothetical protein
MHAMANGLPLVADGKWQMAFIEITPWMVVFAFSSTFVSSSSCNWT